MITIQENKLIIEIEHGSPKELLKDLRKLVFAGFRWCSTSKDKYDADDVNQYVLAQFGEELLETED